MATYNVCWPVETTDGIYDIEAASPEEAIEMAERMIEETPDRISMDLGDSQPGQGHWVEDEDGDIVLDTTDGRLTALGSWVATLLTDPGACVDVTPHPDDPSRVRYETRAGLEFLRRKARELHLI